MATVTTPLAALQSQMDDVVSDPSLDPADRVARLRTLRTELTALAGVADRYIHDQELRRESGAMDRARQFIGARAEANAHGTLLDQAAATPEALAAVGVLSHDELDQRLADGSLEETLLDVEEAWSEAARLRSIEVRRDRARLRRESEVGPSFRTRARELDTRVADAVARARGTEGAASPGTGGGDTGPVPDLHAPPNPAGKVGQKRLLAIAKGALSQPSTVDVYSHTGADGKRVYDESRRVLHQKIIEKLLAGGKSQKHPHVVFMGGGYASGKGTLRRRLEAAGKMPKGAVTLDPDVIKHELPEFRRMLNDGDPEANLATYEEAWDVAQSAQKEAQRRKLHMVVDGLSNTSPEDMLGRVKSFRDAGYEHAEAHYANVPTDVAVRWANHRAEHAERPESRRVIPETLMRATHRDVAATLPGVIDGSRERGKGLDTIRMYDTSGKEPKEVYSLENGKETVHDEAGHRAALDKAHEQVAGVDAPARPDTPVALEEIEKRGLNQWPEKGEVAQRVLGDAKDTQELHRAPGAASPGTTGKVPYALKRKPVHDKIVGGALAGPAGELLGSSHPIATKLAAGGTLSDAEKKTVRDAATAARNGEKPTALFMAGGTASGKSSALTQVPEVVPHAAVHIDPDAFKEQLPEYQKMRDAGERYAANGVHEESADLAVRARDEARELGLNMLIDGTGDSSAAQRDEKGKVTKPGKFAGKMIDADKSGYQVRGLYVTVPTNTAIVRGVRRADETGRHVPVPEIRTQHRNVSRNFPEVASLPFVHDLQVFDTSGDSPERIYHGAGGKELESDRERHRAFLAKAEEAVD